MKKVLFTVFAALICCLNTSVVTAADTAPEMKIFSELKTEVFKFSPFKDIENRLMRLAHKALLNEIESSLIKKIDKLEDLIAYYREPRDWCCPGMDPFPEFFPDDFPFQYFDSSSSSEWDFDSSSDSNWFPDSSSEWNCWDSSSEDSDALEAKIAHLEEKLQIYKELLSAVKDLKELLNN